MQEFFNSIDGLIKFVMFMVKTHYPKFAALQKEVEKTLPDYLKFLGIFFSGVALNFGCMTHMHKDGTDLLEGFCLVISFGKFEGGELCFAEPMIMMPFGCGEMIIFRSALLSHFNKLYKGIRNSIVFFTERNLYHHWLKVTKPELKTAAERADYLKSLDWGFSTQKIPDAELEKYAKEDAEEERLREEERREAKPTMMVGTRRGRNRRVL